MRYRDIDILLGVAIVLVVSGHLFESWTYEYNEYKRILYKFHMELFMTISGSTLYLGKHHLLDIYDWRRTIIKKFKKFSVPFLVFTVLFLIAKVSTGIVERDDVFLMLKLQFITPISGAAGYLWYVYVLFIYYFISPILLISNKNKVSVIITFLLGIYLYLNFPALTAIGQINLLAKYFIFVLLGIHLERYRFILEMLLRDKLHLYVMLLILLILSTGILLVLNIRLLPLVTGIFSLYMIAKLCSSVKLLEYLGRNSFTIYLWNSVFIYVVQVNLPCEFSEFGRLFILCLSGITGPLLLKLLILRMRKSLIRDVLMNII